MNVLQQIRIMVVDDHPIVREGLAMMINAQNDLTVVAKAENGMEAIKQFHQHKPDVTLIDLRMDAMGGVEAIKEIRKQFPFSKFIALTTYEGDEDIYRAVKAGVQGYLLKGMPFEIVLEAIRAVHSGLRRIPPNIANRLAERETIDELTKRELEVLKLIVKGKTNKEIATDLGLTENTVKAYISSIFDKLRVNDRTQAATTAIERGIVYFP
jgi:DNA-binding NarL/FixJ family response regulator